MSLRRLLPDPFVLTLVGVLLLATFMPAAGRAADMLGTVATAAIVMLGGNVAASVAAAAASNLLGVIATPLVAGLLLSASGGAVPLSGIWKIVVQLLLPFAAGHLLRPLLGGWAQRQRALLAWADRVTVLIAVYTAFSAAVITGLWRQFAPSTVVVLLLICAVLLGMVLAWTGLLARWLALTPGDARALRYAGATKSLVSGVPMARVLFPSADIGLIMLPIMIYHQLQLMIGATLARRQAAGP
ncbi:MAG: bile acid:sodium symporter [Steroidobacteraceae bacterium]